MPAAKIFYDTDADLSYIKDKTIVFLGFGNQGAAQAQNLRDSGIPNDSILIANREDRYAVDAKSRGFSVTQDFAKAAEIADSKYKLSREFPNLLLKSSYCLAVLFLLVPDQVQPRIFNQQFTPHLKDDCTVVVASGYNVFYKLLSIPSSTNVVMVAPRMIGSSVRSLYEKGQGFPCFVSVEQDGAGNALKIALAISRAIGATKAGAIESSVREETAMDLFAEQALWPQIIMLFQQAFGVLKDAGFSDEALCYEMWMSKEPAEIFERAAEEGFIQQLKHHSSVSQFGQLSGALALDGTATRQHFEDILHNQVLNGKFCREFSKIEEALEKDGDENPLNELYKKSEASELGQAEKRVRARLVLAIFPQILTGLVVLIDHARGLETDKAQSWGKLIMTDATGVGAMGGLKETGVTANEIEKGVAGLEIDLIVSVKAATETEIAVVTVTRGRDGDKDIERDLKDRVDRRRIREDDVDEHKVKRMRGKSSEIAPLPPLSADGRRPRSRDSDRKSVRGLRDPRDEFEDTMRPVPRRDDRNRESMRDREDRKPIPRPMSPLDDEPVSDTRHHVPSPSPPAKRPSPSYEAPSDPYLDEIKEDDSEARSVFVSQLAARMTARDLGYFFEDKLGDNSVLDSRIVTDRLSRRSKGIAYVEFRSIELVDKAIALTGTIVMGLPIMIQHTEAERNKTHAGDGSINLPPGASGHGATLYVGSLHFNLTESDIKQVFEPFGDLDFVDLHKDPTTGRSKGYAFIHYKRAEDAKMALEQMEGFELAGRTLRVNTVHEKGQMKFATQDSLEENGGGNLNAASRQALMQKLARTEPAPVIMQPTVRPTIAQTMTSKSVLLRNMFDPEEENEADWDKDLAEDVKGECYTKYGHVLHIKVEKDSEGEIYVQFDNVESAKKAVDGLNGRWFGGKQISATFISDAIMQAHR
ncbi:hypothetical protein EW145_g797 [Phellinidium pouzarii]|uniref:Alpha-keto-beta-hydroxylacyl reductoisomerase n=1 Tax=Phellinidium pouzarii TaxID=167371 RepID=A0A4S4LGW5_9AGAM|nr:hypothetical protein EW145_g797 [Phellinidium pouzarii]